MVGLNGLIHDARGGRGGVELAADGAMGDVGGFRREWTKPLTLLPAFESLAGSNLLTDHGQH